MIDRFLMAGLVLGLSAPAFGATSCLDWDLLEKGLAAQGRGSVLLTGTAAKAFLAEMNSIPPVTQYDFPSVRVSVKKDGLTLIWLESGGTECFVTWLSEENGRRALVAALGQPA